MATAWRLATLLSVPLLLAIDVLFSLPETGSSWHPLLFSEWLESALPIFASWMIASLPAWLATTSRPIDSETPAVHESTFAERTPQAT